jgi:hypothetical protein
MSLVFVHEYCRPGQEGDQMLMSIHNINYVKSSLSSLMWLKQRYMDSFCNNYGHKIIINNLDMNDLPGIINDFVFYNKIVQPCNLSVYAINTTHISMLNVAIRDILADRDKSN